MAYLFHQFLALIGVADVAARIMHCISTKMQKMILGRIWQRGLNIG